MLIAVAPVRLTMALRSSLGTENKFRGLHRDDTYSFRKDDLCFMPELKTANIKQQGNYENC